MARDPFANYDAWKLASPYEDEREVTEKWTCNDCGEEISQDNDPIERKGTGSGGKPVTIEYAKCENCATYFADPVTIDDLREFAVYGQVIVDGDGKYLGTKMNREDVEPEDTRDDEDMGRYRDDY